jgi:hypothetical protein
MTPALALTLLTLPMAGSLEFQTRVQEYVETHRRLAAGIEQPLCADPEELYRQTDALASAIREARPLAKEGDIFTPAIAMTFRGRIAALVSRFRIDVDAVVARGEGDLDVRVHDTLPPYFDPALATVVRNLPALPPELEYRFVGRQLVLIDLSAHLVVDVLRNALPAGNRQHHAPATPGVCHMHHDNLPACWM